MNQYIETLLLTGAISAVATLLLPEKNERLRRVVEFGIALFVLVVLCRPLAAATDLGSLLGDIQLPNADITAPGYADETWEKMEESVARGIAADIADRYDLPSGDVQAAVTLHLADNELTVSTLTLTFSGGARMADLVAVRTYAQKTYTPQCEVTIDGG